MKKRFGCKCVRFGIPFSRDPRNPDVGKVPDQGLYEALKAGASGYVVKKLADRDLVEACRATMRGEPFLYPAEVTEVVRDHLSSARAGEQLRDPLTPRETEVIKLIAESYTNRQIAEALVISEKTVERHRAIILEKLGMHDRLQLAELRRQSGRRRWVRRSAWRVSGFYGDVLGSSTDAPVGVLW